MKISSSIRNAILKFGICSALALAVSPQALAQSQPERRDSQQLDERRDDRMQEPSDEAAQARQGRLPRISNGRPERRERPAPLMTRPARTDAGVKGAFELYVEGVTGKSLPVFGASLFNDVPSTFAPFDGAQVNGDYVIGTGDELQVRGWGMVDIDVSVTVDRSGAVHIPRVGTVRVAGIKYRDLQDYLKKSVSRIYSNFELSASIAQTRAVQVYVVGHAVRPGTYTLSAMSTLVNALFTSGGPDSTGSMRNIQVKRGGETVTTFDLYDMLVKGDKSKDVTLRDGDVIFIPEVGPLVALTGNVKQPAIFEMRGDTTMAELVVWAGGFDSSAEGKKVIIEKNVDNTYKIVAEIDAGAQASASALAAVPLKATDVIRMFAPGASPVQVAIPNEYVRVSGEVKQSGMFLIRKGETLRELVLRLGGPTENGFVFATQLKRDSVRQTQQKRLDEIVDRFERELDAAAAQRMRGTADKENAELVGIELERQRATARRMRELKADGRISLELDSDRAEAKHLPDIALQDGDTIVIPRKPGTVDVLGAVFQPASFAHRPYRTAKDYLLMAGGLTDNADKSEMYVIRADGTARSGASMGWFSGMGGYKANLGDTIVVPEKVDRRSWVQSLKEWTQIFYQFGLGAAGLKVLQN